MSDFASISNYTAFCYYTASLNGTKMRIEQVLHMEENHKKNIETNNNTSYLAVFFRIPPLGFGWKQMFGIEMFDGVVLSSI